MSMKYYIKTKNQAQGPFSIEELKKQMLAPAVRIRTEDSDVWIRADHCHELKDHLAPAPNNWLIVSIITLFICLPFGLLGLIRAGQIQYYYRTGHVTQAKVLSIETRRWLLIGIACSVIFYLIIILFYGASILKTLYC